MSVTQQVQLARKGKEPAVVCKMPSGWLVLANRQYLRGYCILLPDPVVSSLNDLDVRLRSAYLTDMTLVGDALLEVTDAVRINYGIMGNSDPALHAHIVPRYLTEPESILHNLPWLYDQAFMNANPFNYKRDKNLMDQLANAIRRRL